MELNVAAELKLCGKVRNVHLSESYPDLVLSNGAVVLEGPVVVDAGCSFDGEGVSLVGTLSSKVRMNCTKCNEEIVEEFSIPFAERFLRVSEAEAEEQDCYSFAGEKLDLDRMVQDLIVLNAPMYGVCREDCKGLCPVCGSNLNNTQCSCQMEDDDNPFAALKGLKELLKDQ